MKRLSLVITLLASMLAFAGCSPSGQAPTPPTPPQPPSQPQPTAPSGTKQWSSPPPMTINTSKEYTAVIDTTLGKITTSLFPKEAPVTVNNFVFLAREAFYDGVKIHRVVKDFVFQTGDPRGDGKGGPGYSFPDEKVTRDYKAGVLAMANSGPNTNGSQFFITLANLTGRLPKNYNLFGEVTGGFDVALAIGQVPVTQQEFGGEKSKPTMDLRVKSVTIQEK